MATVETTIKEFNYKFTVITIILLVLMYQVMVNTNKISLEHGTVAQIASVLKNSEPMTNSYAARLPTVVDSGLTNTNVLNWGNGLNASVCPNKEQADAYLAKSGNDYYSDADYGKQGFLGHIESPVFYDIGDVRKTRDTRAKNSVPVVTVDNVSYIPVNDANGNQVVDSNGMPKWQACPAGMRNVNNTCQPMQEGMDSWGGDNRSSAIEGFGMNDEDLINR
jgi:hypothetical protein